MIHLSVVDSRRAHSPRRPRSWRRWAGFTGGVLLSLAGLATLGFVFLLGAAPWREDSVLFGIGMPSGLLIGCLGVSLAVGGAAVAVGAFRWR
jgi:hypothetical protein